MIVQRLITNKNDIANNKIEELQLPQIGAGEVLVKTGNFALTANNISYAISGNQLGYWQFYPINAEWGIVPVWGFAEIVASNCVETPVGTRFWGLLPMASHFIMKPIKVKKHGFVDGAEHRMALHGVYNRYQITNDDSQQLAAMADARSLLFPLFFTGYVIADYIDDNGLFGASQVIIGSASSKTGFSAAYYVKQIARKSMRVIGLTSKRNTLFTKSLGFYDEVIEYDNFAELRAEIPTIFVDMSGDGALLAGLHNHFKENIKASIMVGATHHDAPRNQSQLPGARPAFFFAPNQIQKRETDWGAGEFSRRAQLANIELVEKIAGVLEIIHSEGAEDVRNSFNQVLQGATPSNIGLILSF